MDETRDADRPGAPPDERRGFLAKLVALIAGAISGMSVIGAALWTFCDPLFRRPRTPRMYAREGSGEQADGGAFVRVASLESLPDDGVPRRFPVVTNLIDAWSFEPGQPIGAVWLRRVPGEDQIQVFHATCPHAGCAISFRPGEGQQAGFFHCPCHNSAFDLNGQKIDLPGKENPSPRPMDSLPYRIDDQGNILVQFMNFYTGIAEKKPKV